MATCKLKPQQRRVLVMVAQGRSNQEIAERLGNSKRTIDTHVQAAMRAMGAKDRTSAVVRAIWQGEIDITAAIEPEEEEKKHGDPLTIP